MDHFSVYVTYKYCFHLEFNPDVAENFSLKSSSLKLYRYVGIVREGKNEELTIFMPQNTPSKSYKHSNFFLKTSSKIIPN